MRRLLALLFLSLSLGLPHLPGFAQAPAKYRLGELQQLRGPALRWQGAEYDPAGFLIFEMSAANPARGGAVEPVFVVRDSQAYIEAGGTALGDWLAFESDADFPGRSDPLGHRWQVSRSLETEPAIVRRRDNGSARLP